MTTDTTSRGVNTTITPTAISVSVVGDTAIFPLPKVRLSSSGSVGGVRGSICGFSHASVRRLRESLATLYIPDCEVIGITLTVPWRDNFSLSEYRASINRCFTLLRYHYPDGGAIYRHEIQARGAPHCHMIYYLPLTCDYAEFCQTVYLTWLKSCPLSDGSLLGFAKFGIKIDKVASEARMWRYLSDHLSKGKQSQLGYVGKQWGILNRKVFCRRKSVDYNLTPRQYIAVRRQLSRLYRYCKKCDCIFGYKHLRRRKYGKITFGRGDTLMKIINFYL